MASFGFNQAAKKMLDYANAAGTFKVMLLQDTANWTPNRDEDFVDDGVNGPADDECTATNYTRKTVSVTISEDDTNDRGKMVFSNVTWTALGGATNNTIVGAVLFLDLGTGDGTAILFAYWDFADITTNGSDFTLSMDATNGNLRITT